MHSLEAHLVTALTRAGVTDVYAVVAPLRILLKEQGACLDTLELASGEKFIDGKSGDDDDDILAELIDDVCADERDLARARSDLVAEIYTRARGRWLGVEPPAKKRAKAQV